MPRDVSTVDGARGKSDVRHQEAAVTGYATFLGALHRYQEAYGEQRERCLVKNALLLEDVEREHKVAGVPGGLLALGVTAKDMVSLQVDVLVTPDTGRIGKLRAC